MTKKKTKDLTLADTLEIKMPEDLADRIKQKLVDENIDRIVEIHKQIKYHVEKAQELQDEMKSITEGI